MKISARNTLVGKIVEIHEGPVSTEVTIETRRRRKDRFVDHHDLR